MLFLDSNYFDIFSILLNLMAKITYIDHEGNSQTIEADNCLSVMEGSYSKNIPGIDADCGGSMACAMLFMSKKMVK